MFLLNKNLLNNLAILRLILWEWVWQDLSIVSSDIVNLRCLLWEWVW